MSSPKYKILEHTADIRIRVYGASTRELFSNAAYALFCVIVEDIETVLEKEKRQISVDPVKKELSDGVKSRDLEGLLVRWLSELYYRFEVDGLIFKKFDILEMSEGRLTARVYGERFDAARHRLKTDIKGVTYHGLYIRQNKGKWEAEVIFDV